MANYNVPASAKPVTISGLHTSLLNEKLRIAGMALSYDSEHQVLLLHDSMSHACLVDTSLVLDSMIGDSSLRESRTVVTIIGYLEHVKDGSPIPTVPAFVEAPFIDNTLVLRAILVTSSRDLDLLLWEQSIIQDAHSNVEAYADEYQGINDS